LANPPKATIFGNRRAMDKQDRQNTYQPNTEARSRNKFCGEKAISITYSECVSVTLDIQHVKDIRPVILSSVACLNVTFFLSHYLINVHEIREKNC